MGPMGRFVSCHLCPFWSLVVRISGEGVECTFPEVHRVILFPPDVNVRPIVWALPSLP